MLIILQMRLYVLYNRSKKILFIIVLGFIIQVVTMLVCMIRLTILDVDGFNQIGTITTYRTSETTDIFVSYSVTTFYEFLLFSLALWAAIQCRGRPSVANRTGARGVRAILLKGNVIYFLISLLYMIAYWVIPLTLPSEYLYILPCFGLAMYTILGCHIILHIRSAASQFSSSTNASQPDSRGSHYNFIVLHDPTHSSIYDDTCNI
ncbi:hypothetical protein V8B97DRAFT_1362415 [Scleroderma yunnanense]